LGEEGGFVLGGLGELFGDCKKVVEEIYGALIGEYLSLL
jgi:hypothetical protein